MSTCRLIPEFEPQSGVILTWPHTASAWRDSLDAIEPVYLELVQAISRYEPVLVICHDDLHRLRIEQLLANSKADTARIHWVVVPTNDTWVRDYGPLSMMIDQHTALVDFGFDGWGGKHASALDNRASRALQDAGVFRAPGPAPQALVLEGGSIETDGCGTLLTTSRCLVDAGRNRGMDRDAVQNSLQDLLCIERTLWLDHGYIAGDDTDGHVDMLARFCTPHDIAYLQCNDLDDEHYAELGAMERQLQSFTACDGTPYTLHALPLPAPVLSSTGVRLPASYANFLIINNAVLLPVYNDPADETARAVLADCFSGRDIVPIKCLPLIEQYGSLHCATLQLADGILSYPLLSRIERELTKQH